jgi:putative transposase
VPLEGKTSKFKDSQIMAILKQNEAGIKVPGIGREHGISSATFLLRIAIVSG